MTRTAGRSHAALNDFPVSPAGPEILAYVVLALAVLLAWLPLAQHYYLIADDHVLVHDLDGGLMEFLRIDFHRWGAWRMLGILVIVLLSRAPYLYGSIVIALHATTSCLYMAVLREYLGGRWLPLFLALIFAAFPFASGALLWANAANLPVLEALFLITLLVFSRWGAAPRRQPAVFCATLALTIVAQLVQENLIVAFFICGSYVWIMSQPRTWRELFGAMRTNFSGFGPAVGVLVYLVAYRLTKTHTMVKTETLHWQSAFSPLVYQYAALDSLKCWLYSDCRALLFRDWRPPLAISICFLAIALGVCLAMFVRGRRTYAAPRPPPRLLFYIAMLCLGASAIFAVAGGFSLDSRKRYCLLPLVLMAIGWVVGRSRSAHSAGRAGPGAAAAVAAVIALGAFSTWLNIGIWRHETKMHDLLLDTIAQNRLPGPICIRWEPSIPNKWGKTEWEFRPDDPKIISSDLLFKHHYSADVAVGAVPCQTILELDDKNERWHVLKTVRPQ